MMELTSMLEEARDAGISIGAIERMAGLAAHDLYKVANGKRPTSRQYVTRIGLAIARLKRAEQPGEDHASAAYRLAIAHVALAFGADPAAILKADPSRRATADEEWLRAAQLRRIALYIASVHLNVPGARLARAARMSAAAVSLALNAIEDARDGDPALEQLLARIEEALSA